MNIDPFSETWMLVKQQATARLEKLQGDLEDDLSERDTANIRGRIAEIRGILGLEHGEIVPYVKSANYIG